MNDPLKKEAADKTKQLAEIDQCTKLMVDMLPPLWRGIYDGLLEQKFAKDEAMRLLCVYIFSQGTGERKA